MALWVPPTPPHRRQAHRLLLARTLLWGGGALITSPALLQLRTPACSGLLAARPLGEQQPLLGLRPMGCGAVQRQQQAGRMLLCSGDAPCALMWRMAPPLCRQAFGWCPVWRLFLSASACSVDRVCACAAWRQQGQEVADLSAFPLLFHLQIAQSCMLLGMRATRAPCSAMAPDAEGQEFCVTTADKALEGEG